MRYELTDDEWAAIKPMLPNKPRGVPRVNDRRVLKGIFWVLRSGAPWRELPERAIPLAIAANACSITATAVIPNCIEPCATYAVSWHTPGIPLGGETSMTDEALVSRLPKCELHIHIEGSLEPELMFALASRNGIRLPYPSVEAVRAAYRFTQLQDFLDLYYRGMSVLITERDFFDLAWAYLERAHADNVRHVEMFFDPQGHTRRGIAFSTVIDGLHGAIEKAAGELGVSASLIMCFLRDLDEADAQRTLDMALPHRARIVGVGLDSAERGNPPAKFRHVFGRAREAGFFLCAHAGEEGPPAYVWEAIDVLGVNRIDHGIRSLEDAALVERIARDRKPLTVCPLSNLRLRVVQDLKHHPLRRMMEKDLLVTVNSDDPAYFGGYVNDNYRAVQQALDLSRDEIVMIARNSFIASMMPEAEKRRALADFDQVMAGIGG